MLFEKLRKPQCVLVADEGGVLSSAFFSIETATAGGDETYLIAKGVTTVGGLREVAADLARLTDEMMAEFGHAPLFDIVFSSRDADLATLVGGIDYVDDLPRGLKPSDDAGGDGERWSDVEVTYAAGSRRDVARVRGFLGDFECYADSHYRDVACKRGRIMWRANAVGANISSVLERQLWTSGNDVVSRARHSAVSHIAARALQGNGSDVLRGLPLGLIPVLGPTNGGKSAFCERLAATLKLPYVYATEAQGEPHPASKVNAVWIRNIDRAMGVASSAAAVTGAFAAIVDSGRQAVWTTPGGMGARGLPNQFSTRFTDASNALAELGLRAFLVLNPSHVDETYLAEFTNTVMLMSSAWIYVREFDRKKMFTLDVQAKPLRDTRRLTFTFDDRKVVVEPVGSTGNVVGGISARSPGPEVRSRGPADPYSSMLQRAFRNV